MLDDSGPVNKRTGLSPESSVVENDRKEKEKKKRKVKRSIFYYLDRTLKTSSRVSAQLTGELARPVQEIISLGRKRPVKLELV